MANPRDTTHEPKHPPHDPKEMWQPKDDPSPRSFEKTVKDRDVTAPETPETYHFPNTVQYMGVTHEGPGAKPPGALPEDAPRDPRTNQPHAEHENPMAGKDAITASTVGKAIGTASRAEHPTPMAGIGPRTAQSEPVSVANRLQGAIAELEAHPSPAKTKAAAALKAVVADLAKEDPRGDHSPSTPNSPR